MECVILVVVLSPLVGGITGGSPVRDSNLAPAANLAQATSGTGFQIHHFGIRSIHRQHMSRAEVDADFTAFTPFFFDGYRG